jgi:hypothetical protein
VLIGTLVKDVETGNIGRVVAVCQPEVLVDFEYELELSMHQGKWVSRFDVEEVNNGA